MITEYLGLDKGTLWDRIEEAKDDPTDPYYGISDDEGNNVRSTLHEVEFDIDPKDGRVKSSRLNNGQVFSTKTERLNVIVAAHKVMEDMTSEDRLDYIRSFGYCLHCGEKINGTCNCFDPVME